MSQNIGELVALIKADISNLEKNVDKAARDTKKATSEIGQSLNGIPWKAVGVAAAAAGAVSIYALQKVAMEAVNLAEIQEGAEKRLQAVIKATGGAAGITAEEMFNMARSFQEVTTTGDEVIIQGQAILATFKNISGTAFQRTTMAALDMAEVMGVSLKSAMIQLGKAVNDPATGLSMLTRVGITFNDVQKKQIKDLQAQGKLFEAQNVILKEVESQFGGAAKAARDQYGGAVKAAKNVMGDFLEEVGFAITKNEDMIAVVKRVEGQFKSAIEYVKQNEESFQALGDAIAGTIDLASQFIGVMTRVATATIAAAFSIDTEVTALDDMDDVLRSIAEQKASEIGLDLTGQTEADIDIDAEGFLEKRKELEDAIASGFSQEDLAAKEAELNDVFEKLKELDLAEAIKNDDELATAAEAMLEYENDLIKQRLEIRRKGLEQAVADEGAAFEAFASISSKELVDIKNKELLKTKIKKQAQKQAIADASFFFAEMGKHSDAAFAVWKGVEIAKAVVSTISSAQLAYQRGLESAPGPAGMALGVLYAASAIAAGMARVAQISSTNPSSGSAAGVSAGGGNASVPATATPQPDLPSVYGEDSKEENKLPQTQIIFQNPVIDSDERMAQIVSHINKLVEEDQVELNASTAIEVRG